jgi:hypothetical protein
VTKPIRRNFAHLSAAERAAYIEAVRQADLHAFSDGVSYWDKQDQIHQSTHNHGGFTTGTGPRTRALLRMVREGRSTFRTLRCWER